MLFCLSSVINLFSLPHQTNKSITILTGCDIDDANESEMSVSDDEQDRDEPETLVGDNEQDINQDWNSN